MRSTYATLALASVLLAAPLAAPAAAIGVPIVDNLWFWPDECGEESYWFYLFAGSASVDRVYVDDDGHVHVEASTQGRVVNWEAHCERGVLVVLPTGSDEGPRHERDACPTCGIDLLP